MSSTSSIPTAFDRLAARLLLANCGGLYPKAQLTRVITNYIDAPPAPDLPFAVLRFAEGREGYLSTHAMDRLGRMDYDVEAFIFLGGLETPIDELHNRAKYWPATLLSVLCTDTQLAGSSPALGADHIGGDKFRLPMTIGPWEWGADKSLWFGIRLIIPVTQKFEVTPP